MIYLDAAATTFQKPPQVMQTVCRVMRRCASPGRGGYEAAAEADRLLYDCREAAAELFDAAPEQVVFTMNATHGLNIAIRSLVKPGSRVVISGYEHNAVMRPLYALRARIDAICPPLFEDALFLEGLEKSLQQPCSAVILTHVSNVFGWCLPIEAAAECCRRHRVPLIIDAAQSAGTLPVQLQKTGAAFIAIPGHKGLYGPQGTGILLCGEPGHPLLYGGTGSQSKLLGMPEDLPERHEAGTPNVPGIAGLFAGLQFIRSVGTERILRHERRLCRRTVQILERCSDMEVFSACDPDRQTGVLSVRWRGDCEELAQRLAEWGICVRAGLHCAPRAHQTVGTMESGTVRFSFSWFNRECELNRMDEILFKISGR